MRIASFVFLWLVLALLVNLAVSVAYPPYREMIRDFRTHLVPGFVQKNPDAVINPQGGQMASNSLQNDQALAESLSRMNAGLDVLIASSSGAQSHTGSMQVATGTTASGASVHTVIPATTQTGVVTEDVIPVSGLLLARLMPDYMPKKVANKGIFDIHIFNSIAYSTYMDEKTKLKIYAFWETYSVMLSNLKLVSSVYGVKETDTFFNSTFFLNATAKKDTTVRFVTELEGKAIGLEFPKSQYQKIKKLLLKP